MSRIVWVSMLCAVAVSGSAFGQVNLLDANPASATFNNPSFERPDVEFALNDADVWTEGGPRVMTDTPGGTFPIMAGVGVFENPATAEGGRINGADGSQLGYIFSHTLNDFFTGQPVDHSTSQVLGLTFEAGKQYQLTIGFANAQAVAGTDSELKFALFDASNPSVDLAFDVLSSTDLNGTALTDFSVTTDPITGGTVGEQIGIRITTHTDISSSSARGQFDFDNVRLTVVPEPGTAGLSVLAASATLSLRARRRR